MRLQPLKFEELPGWSPEAFQSVWPSYWASCKALLEGLPPLRSGVYPPPEMTALSRIAFGLHNDPAVISRFFQENFRPLEVLNDAGGSEGFVTGYYEPELDGALAPSAEYCAPVLARPSDLRDMRGKETAGWAAAFEGAQETADGCLTPYPTRAQIENGAIDRATAPILWLRDHVEVFFAQVQGSARVRLPDGTRKRLVYAGRNGRPYTSIGRILIARGEIPAEEMSLARCKAWLRANGLKPGDRGRMVLQANDSYVFFRLEEDLDSRSGPIGAQGIPLVSLRSIAVDRTVWPYGTPVWIAADLSSAGIGDGPTGRLMVAQDTGSAIVGPARGDLFIGCGAQAGEIAGLIRHSARFIVLAPVGIADHGAA